jgi:hypothetical protein
MSDRLSRLAPLTGVAFAVLVIVGVFTGGGETPDANARPAKVISFYAANRSEIETSSIIFAIAFLVLVLFAASLRSYLRRTAAAEGLAAIVLAGAVLMAAGALITTAAEYGLAHNLSGLTPATAQTMNLISNEFFLPIIGGAFLLAVASGLAILRGALLPRWLGWVAIVLGIAALIPPASFPALLVFVIWSIVVSILMYRRTGPDASTPTPREPDPLGAPGG